MQLLKSTFKCKVLALFFLLSQPCSQAFTLPSGSAIGGSLQDPPMGQEASLKAPFTFGSMFQQHRRPSLSLQYTRKQVEMPLAPLPNTSNPYIILKLHSQATVQEIKRAYRVAALKYHPDVRVSSSSTPEERAKANDDFARINAAYALLIGKGDQVTRTRKRTPSRPPPSKTTSHASKSTGTTRKHTSRKYSGYYGGTSGQDQESRYVNHHFSHHQSQPSDKGYTRQSYSSRRAQQFSNKDYTGVRGTRVTTKYSRQAYGRTNNGSEVNEEENFTRYNGPDYSVTTRRQNAQKSQTSVGKRTKYNRQGYGGTSFDAQTASKVDQDFNRYNGPDNVSSSRPPRTPYFGKRYTRQGYGGTSTDAQREREVNLKFSRYSVHDQTYVTPSAGKVPSEYTREVRERKKYTRQSYGGTTTDANHSAAIGGTKDSVSHAQVQTKDKSATYKSQTNTQKPKANPFFFMQLSTEACTEVKKQIENKIKENTKHVQQHVHEVLSSGHEKSQSKKVRVETAQTHKSSSACSQKVATKEKTEARVTGWPSIPRGKYGGTSSEAGSFTTLYEKNTPKQTSTKENRKYGDFFDANSFHARWNSSNDMKNSGSTQSSQTIEKITSGADPQVNQSYQQPRNEEFLEKIADDLSTAVQSMVKNLFSNLVAAAAKTTSIPSPSEGHQFSPLEACAIIYEHEVNPSMDKQEAITIILNKNYIPVTRMQFYSVYRKFREGKISKQHRWGDSF